LVAGLTGILAGAVTGGVVGALVKTGVPVDDAPYNAEGIRRGSVRGRSHMVAGRHASVFEDGYAEGLSSSNGGLGREVHTGFSHRYQRAQQFRYPAA